MADSVIQLSDDKLSTKHIKAAEDALKDAETILERASLSMSSDGGTETHEGIKLFSAHAAKVDQIRGSTERLKNAAQSCMELLDNGPNTLREADKSFKGKLNTETGKKSVWGTVGKTAMVATVPGAAGFWAIKSLFSHSEKTPQPPKHEKSGTQTITVTYEPPLPDEDHLPIDKTNENRVLEMYSNGERWNTYEMDQRIDYTNASGERTGYYVSDDGCTWYAAARYRQVNGAEKELKFFTPGGNANQWVDTIDKNVFDVLSTDNADAIKRNTIAVSTETDVIGDFPYSGNHVAYVELVKDGYVYYSEGAWPNHHTTFGYMKRRSIEEFSKNFEYIICAK